MKQTLLNLAMTLGLAGFALCQTPSDKHIAQEYQSWAIEGTITDSLGKVLDGTEVAVVARDRSTTMTDPKGQYILKGTQAGRYTVSARKDGYAWRFRRVQLIPGMRLRVDLKLDREAVLSGRVLTRDGAPLANARVSAWAREFIDGNAIFLYTGGARTDDTGRYRIAGPGLSQGTYYVGVNPKNAEVQKHYQQDPKQPRKTRFAYPSVFYPGVQSFGDTTPVYLRNAEQREGLDLIVEKVATFCATGSVFFNGVGRGSAEASLKLAQRAKGWGDFIGDGRTSPGQEFEICGLVPGIHYTLTAQVWGEESKLGGLAERDFEGNRRDAELGSLDIGSLSVEAGQPVRGKITIERHESDESFPKNGVLVLARTEGLPGYMNETREIQVARTGEFVFPNVFPHEHWLRVLGLAPGYYVKEANCGRYDLLKEPWQPGCGEIHVLLGLDGASISGQAVNEDGKPVDDADVILVPKGVSRKIAAQPVDQDGHFQFSSVVPGNYSVFAIVGIPEAEAQNPDVVRKYLSDATELDLDPSDRKTLTLKVSNVDQ